ncbi:MAG: ATP-grasp domain-containing protein [Planctomycetes bacterium]|nr:ATP-grasp domain-containing protein [Planctomycetota bacterium]
MRCVDVRYRPGREAPEDIVGSAGLEPGSCVIYWGTLPLMRQIQLHRAWSPGGWCTTENLACSRYYAHFGPHLLNQRYTLMPGGEAIRHRDWLFTSFAHNDQVFVRPDGVQKLFPGRLVSIDDFLGALAPARYDRETLVLVAEPRPVGTEWRIVVAEGRFVAASQYCDGGVRDVRAGCPDSVQSFVEEVLSKVRWRPDPLYAMDVCESDGSLYVLELNSFSCSGLYSCEPSAVVEAASTVATRSWEASTKAGPTRGS